MAAIPASALASLSGPLHNFIPKIQNSGFSWNFPHRNQLVSSLTATLYPRRPAQISNFVSPSQLNCSPPDETALKGCDILAEALHRQGVALVFGYPGDASIEILEALRRRKTIKNVLARHEQGSVFAAEGYARASGVPGVCITTSGPGATNIVSGLANAHADGVPLVAITGQVSSHLMGSGAFQDTPIVKVTRPITKHCYLVLDAEDISRIVKEAFFVASSGRPGPVLIDIPKDIQLRKAVPKWDERMRLDAYLSRLPKPPRETSLEKIVSMIHESRRPVLCVGGGCLNSAEELRRFVGLTGIPVVSTMMAMGCYPNSDEEHSLQMIGLYGTAHANYAVQKCDLLLAFGVRFDYHATGSIKAFAKQAQIVRVDIDPKEIEKKMPTNLSLCCDIKLVLQGTNKLLERQVKLDFSSWREEIEEEKMATIYSIPSPHHEKAHGDVIHPWYVIQVLDKLTDGNAIICTGTGDHQIWAAQFYTHKHPKHLLIPGGFGPMGFGLPATIGVAVARPGKIVVNVDGDGSFLMNVQELATVRALDACVKTVIFNNQHLGMVARWEHLHGISDRPHSCLGNPSNPSEIFPDILKFAEGCGIPAARVTRKSRLVDEIQKMLDTPGPYLLDVILPLEDHPVPTIPI